MPAYPAILTKADWDRNKGTIGKQPDERGVSAALDAVWNHWSQIEWNAALDCRPDSLKILPRALILHLLMRLQHAVARVAATRAALLELGGVAAAVAGGEGAGALPKRTVGHVRKMQKAAIALAAELEQNNFQREALMARKAKGYSRLREYDLDGFLDDPRLASLYLPAAKSGFCELSWRFLMVTRCALHGKLPAPEKVPQIFREFVENDAADIGVEKQTPLVVLHEAGVLVSPPAGSEQQVLEAWEAAHRECQKMFPSRYRHWRNVLPLDDDDGLLLDPALQA